LAWLHFTSEAIIFSFSSMNDSIGGARAILLNRLAKHVELLKTCSHRNSMHGPLGRGEAVWNHYFSLHPPQVLCESMIQGAP
jgi:hypothetical protein